VNPLKRPSLPPWLIVAGGVDNRGGMDKGNLALAQYLVREKREVHIVAHRVELELSRMPNVKVYLAASPLGSSFLGERNLTSIGRGAAKTLLSTSKHAVVLTNGGNCAWPGVNWVHSVHHAWNRVDGSAPLWFRARNAVTKSAAKRREARAFAASKIIVANSERTRADIARLNSAWGERVVTVYLGSAASAHGTTPSERAAARGSLSLPESIPVALFAGALSYDNNKGLDVLIDAWYRFLKAGTGSAHLLIAGGGNAVDAWRARLAADPVLANTTTVLGYREDIEILRAASDVLIAPSRYEAYGLAAHEAICSGLPVITGANAGIAERFPAELRDVLLTDPTNAADLASRLGHWRATLPELQLRFASFARALRSYTWDDMAANIVDVAEARA